LSPKSFEAVWLKFCRDESRQEFCFSPRNIVEIPVKIALLSWPPRILPRFAEVHPGEILAAEKFLPGENLDEIRGRIPAKFWPPGFFLPGENHGEIRGRIPARFLAAEIFASRRESRRDSQQDRGEILAAGNFSSRRESCRDPAGIPAERKNPGGQNLAAIPAGFPSRSRRDPAKIPDLILQGLTRSNSQHGSVVPSRLLSRRGLLFRELPRHIFLC